MDAGWTALPSVIIENQRQLGLNPLDFNIILYLASKWWTAEGKPYPSKATMAKAAQKAALGFLTPKNSFFQSIIWLPAVAFYHCLESKAH